MARSRRAWLALLAMVLLGTLALNAAGPVAASTTPTATPIDQMPLAGRLGGPLDELLAERGTPDWTGTGLVGYNELDLAGQPTIVVVYYDLARTITSISLVYPAKPAAFADPAALARTVSEVLPRDASCATDPVANDFGPEVYGCASPALADIVTADTLRLTGRAGEAGSFSYSIDPYVDAWYEIIVQFGTGLATAVTPEAGDTTALSARLGGSRSDWERRYGKPIGEERYDAYDGTMTYTLYSNPAGGEISAAFDDNNNVTAISITMSAVETADVISTFALTAVASYGPADAICGDTTWLPSPNDPGDLSAVGIACDSPALATPGYRPTLVVTIHFIAHKSVGLDARVILRTIN